MINQLFQIGDFCFRVVCEKEIIPPKNFMKFAVEEGEESYTYRIRFVDEFPEPVGEVAAKRENLLVTKQGALETRYIGVLGLDRSYACYQEISDKETEILLWSEYEEAMVYDTVFTSLLALEKRLLQKDGMILHCAYMRYQDMAILFSAPSQTGKSTQANLWEQYRGTETMNGDRALIQKVDGQWMAKGWPVCGSSEICNNEETPIRAIVMLSQGKTNEITRLTAGKAFSLLYSQVTVNSWDREMTMKVMGLEEQLVGEVPFYHLSCTISEEAVQCLETALEKEL